MQRNQTTQPWMNSTVRMAFSILLVFCLFPAGFAYGESPLSMADPDGQGLIMERLSISIAAHGPLSLTEMEMVFRNPQNRQIEGKFKATLPVGATISRFAKEVEGKLMEGEVVERKKATRIYTEILHTMRDPALLSQDQGNVFNARIFPIGPKQTTRILLSYSQVTAAGSDGLRKLIVPLKGLESIKTFEFLALCRPLEGERVFTSSTSKQERQLVSKDKIIFAEELTEENFTPKDDIRLIFRPSKNPKPTLLKAGNFQMISVVPNVPQMPKYEGQRNWSLYVDTSASMAQRGDLKLKALKGLVDGFSHGENVTFHAFDLTTETFGTATTGNDTELDIYFKRIAERKFLGGTDFVHLAKAISKDAKTQKAPAEFVIVTDGVATFSSKEVKDIVDALVIPSRHKLSVVVIGSKEDDRLTRAIVEKGAGRVVRIPLTSNWEAAVEEATSQLRKPSGVTVTLYDENAKWIEPSVFRDVRPGMELVAFSALNDNEASQAAMTWTNPVDGKTTDIQINPTSKAIAEFTPLLSRECWHGRIKYLEKLKDQTADSAKRTRLDNEMIDISTTHRVLCSLTSLLVLESEEDYIKYGITRKGLSDILIVGDKGVELKKRSISQSMKDKIAAQKLAEETARKEAEERQRKRDAEKKSYLYKAKKALSSLSGAFTRSAESDSMVLAEAASTQTEGMEEESFDGDSASSVGSAPDFGGAPRNGGGDHSANRGAGGASEVIADAVDAEHDAFSDSDDEAELSEAPVASPRRAPSIRRPTVRRAPPRTASDTSVTSGDVVRERRVMGAPPSPPESRPSTTRPSGRVTPAPKRTAPSWVGDANYTPFKKTLVKLEKAVRANPKDRRKRNAYCWALMKAQKYDVLLNEGLDWQNYDPSNPMVYEFIGIALMALGNESDALRAYASIAEVSPSASGLLNRGGYLLMKLGKYETAETLFRFAIERRPDHHNNYRGLALSLWYQERFKDAVDVLIEVLAKEHNSRYKSLNRVLKEELGYVLRGWYHKSPSDLKEAREIARKHGVNLQRTDDARITLHWETDANDVDLHVVDPANEECYYSHKTNASGVTLYADLTQGLGPEVISVPKGRIVDGAYHVGVKYFSAGPMGVSRGIVLIQQEDENGMPRVQIEAFTLLPAVEGQSQDMRHITVLEN